MISNLHENLLLRTTNKVLVLIQTGFFFRVVIRSMSTWSWWIRIRTHIESFFSFFSPGEPYIYRCFRRWFTHPLVGHRIHPALGSPTSFGHGFSPSCSPCAPECETMDTADSVCENSDGFVVCLHGGCLLPLTSHIWFAKKKRQPM